MPFLLNRRRFVVGTGLAIASIRSAFAHGPEPVGFAEAVSPTWPAHGCASIVVAAHGAPALAGLDELAAGRLAGGTQETSWAARGIAAGRGADMIFHVGDGPSGDVFRRGCAEHTVSVDLSSATARPGSVESQLLIAHDIAATLMGRGGIGIDYEDLCMVLGAGTKPTFGIGVANGEERTVRAMHAAMEWFGPLLPRRSGVLVSIASGLADLRLNEARMALNVAREAFSSDALMLYGTSRDRMLAPDEVRVSLVVTGQPRVPPDVAM